MTKYDEYRDVCSAKRKAESDLMNHRIAVDSLEDKLVDLNRQQRALAIEILMEVSGSPQTLTWELGGPPDGGLAALTGRDMPSPVWSVSKPLTAEETRTWVGARPLKEPPAKPPPIPKPNYTLGPVPPNAIERDR